SNLHVLSLEAICVAAERPSAGAGRASATEIPNPGIESRNCRQRVERISGAVSLTQEAMNGVASLVVVDALFLLRAVRLASLSEADSCPAPRVEIRRNRLRVIFTSAIDIQPANSVQSVRVYRAMRFAIARRACDSRVPSRQTALRQRRLDVTKH